MTKLFLSPKRCSTCNFSTKVPAQLIKHEKTVHRKCHECGVSFTNSNNLTQHKRTHIPRDKPCFGCGTDRTFESYSSMLVHLEGGNCTVTKEALNIMVAQSFYSRHVIVKEHRMALLSGKPRAKVIHFSRKEQKRQKDVETGGKKEDAEDGRSIGSREENDGGISLKMEALAITSPSEAIPGGKDGDSSPVKDTIPTSSMTRDVNLALFTIGSHPRPPPVLPATVHIVPPTPYTCSSCKKPFPTLPEAQQHVSSPAHDLLAFKCPDEKCTRRFKCLSGLVQHVEMKRCGDGMIIGGVIGKLLHYVHVTVSPLGRRGVGKLDGGVLV